MKSIGDPISTNKSSAKGIENYFKSFSGAFYFFYKKYFVTRIFWGRSNFYKNLVHTFVGVITFTIFVSGFTSQLLSSETPQRTLQENQQTIGNIDLLAQGGSVQTILVANTTANFQIINYTVKEGDTYEQIASNFSVTQESIKLSNLDQINYYDDNPPVGKTLRIPEINGLLIKIEEGDNLESIKAELTQGNELDIIEINNLKEPGYELPVGEFILVPDGLIDPPPPPTPQIRYTAPPPPAPIPSPSEAVLAGVQFIDPLSHPDCSGYSYSRGYSSWHFGVDLAKRGGCPIRAAAAGTVVYAGWGNYGEGFYVAIDHGNGIRTVYLHGDGQIWVNTGDSVSQGQDIMYMGCTGRCTGTHLHLGLRQDGTYIDPSPYIPYWRPT